MGFKHFEQLWEAAEALNVEVHGPGNTYGYDAERAINILRNIESATESEFGELLLFLTHVTATRNINAFKVLEEALENLKIDELGKDES